MSDLMLDVGQAVEVKEAFRRGDWSSGDVKRFSESDKDKMRLFRAVLLGHAEIKLIEHLIDCDADPFVPDGWKVEEHRKGGLVQWNPMKVKLYLSKSQQNGKVIEGNKLLRELAKVPVMNANVLDYLLAHPELIPDEWKGKAVFFWGTIYRDSNGYLYVRYLDWNGGRWYWGYGWLDNDFNGLNPAALSQVGA